MLSSSFNPNASQRRRRDQQEDSFVTNSSMRATSELSCVSKSDLVPMKDMCWFRGGPEIRPARLDDSHIHQAPLPFGLRAIVRPVNRPVGESMPCFLIFKHSEIRIEQNLLVAAPIELPRGTVMKKSQYSQVTFMGELTPIEGPGVVLRLSAEGSAVVVEVSGMTRSVAETIRGILEARGSPMFIADW